MAKYNTYECLLVIHAISINTYTKYIPYIFIVLFIMAFAFCIYPKNIIKNNNKCYNTDQLRFSFSVTLKAKLSSSFVKNIKI